MLFFFQAEDGIRDLVRSRGLGDVYKRQARSRGAPLEVERGAADEGEDCGETDAQATSVPGLSLIHI